MKGLNKLQKLQKSLDEIAKQLDKHALIKQFEGEIPVGNLVKPENGRLLKWYYAKMRKDGLGKEEALEKSTTLINREQKYSKTMKLLKASENELTKISKILKIIK